MLRARLLGGIFGVCCAALAAANSGSGTKPVVDKLKPKFAVREEPSRIVLTWSGPVGEPMRDDVIVAFDRFKADRRRIVIALNSPGGSIAYGRTVAAAIRNASQGHEIDTLVEQGGVCASMCVPIYLAGAERLAHPAARFMFHMASLNLDPASPVTAQGDEVAVAKYRKVMETLATDDLFENDIGTHGVNAAWLARMRTRIDGRDVWVTGQQLVDEGSDIVNKLVGTAER
jgi:ATP-dependent protease ClpP protease subunit